jgi:hypothetical protein
MSSTTSPYNKYFSDFTTTYMNQIARWIINCFFFPTYVGLWYLIITEIPKSIIALPIDIVWIDFVQVSLSLWAIFAVCVAILPILLSVFARTYWHGWRPKQSAYLVGLCLPLLVILYGYGLESLLLSCFFIANLYYFFQYIFTKRYQFIVIYPVIFCAFTILIPGVLNYDTSWIKNFLLFWIFIAILMILPRVSFLILSKEDTLITFPLSVNLSKHLIKVGSIAVLLLLLFVNIPIDGAIIGVLGLLSIWITIGPDYLRSDQRAQLRKIFAYLRHERLRRVISPTTLFYSSVSIVYQYIKRIFFLEKQGFVIGVLFIFAVITNYPSTQILDSNSALTLITRVFITFVILSIVFVMLQILQQRQRYIIVPLETKDNLFSFAELFKFHLVDQLKQISLLLNLKHVENKYIDNNFLAAFFVTSGQEQEFIQEMQLLSNISNAPNIWVNLLNSILRTLAVVRISGVIEAHANENLHIRIDFTRRGRESISVSINESGFNPDESFNEGMIKNAARILAIKLILQLGNGSHLASSPESFNHFLSGLQASAMNSVWKATDSYRKSIQIEETIRNSFGIGHYHLGAILMLQGQWEEGTKHLQRAESSGPPLAEVHYMLALAQLTENYAYLDERGVEFKAIERRCKTALELRPGFSEVYHLLGTLYYQRAKLIEMKETRRDKNIQTAAQSNQSTSLVRILNCKNDYKRSEYHLRQAYASYTRNLRRVQLSNRFTVQPDTQTEFERVVRERFTVLHRLADALRSREHFTEAESYYEDVLSALPTNIRTLIDLSKTYCLAGGWQKADEFLNRVVRRIPEAAWNADVNFYIGWTFAGGVANQRFLNPVIKLLLPRKFGNDFDQENKEYLGKALSHLDYALHQRPQYMDRWNQNDWMEHFIKATSYLKVELDSKTIYSAELSKNGTQYISSLWFWLAWRMNGYTNKNKIINYISKDIEQYTTKIEQYTTKIEQYTTKIEQYTTKIEQYITRIEQYITRIEQYITRIEPLSQQIPDATFQHKLKKYADELKKENPGILRKYVERFTRYVSILINLIKGIKPDLQELTKYVEELTKYVEELTKYVEELTQKLQNEVKQERLGILTKHVEELTKYAEKFQIETKDYSRVVLVKHVKVITKSAKAITKSARAILQNSSTKIPLEIVQYPKESFEIIYKNLQDHRHAYAELQDNIHYSRRFEGIPHAHSRMNLAKSMVGNWEDASNKIESVAAKGITFSERWMIDVFAEVSLLVIKLLCEAKLYKMAYFISRKSKGILSKWQERWDKQYPPSSSETFFLFTPRVFQFQLASLLSWVSYCALKINEDVESKAISIDNLDVIEAITIQQHLQEAFRLYLRHPLAMFVQSQMFYNNKQFQLSIDELYRLLGVIEPFDPSSLVAGWKVNQRLSEAKSNYLDPDFKSDGYEEITIRSMLSKQQRISGQLQFDNVVNVSKVYEKLAEVFVELNEVEFATHHMTNAIIHSSYRDIDADYLIELLYQFNTLNFFVDAQGVIKSLRFERTMIENMLLSQCKIHEPDILECIIATRIGDYISSKNLGEEKLRELQDLYNAPDFFGFYVDKLESLEHRRNKKEGTTDNSEKKLIEKALDMSIKEKLNKVTKKGLSEFFFNATKYRDFLGELYLEPLKKNLDDKMIVVRFITFLCEEATRLLELLAIIENNIVYNQIELGLLSKESDSKESDSKKGTSRLDELLEDSIDKLRWLFKLSSNGENKHANQRYALHLANSYDTKGWLYFRQFMNNPSNPEKLEKARENLQMALEYNQDLSIVYYHLARVDLAALENLLGKAKIEEEDIKSINQYLFRMYRNWEEATKKDKHKRFTEQLAWLGLTIENYRKTWEQRNSKFLQ